MVYNGILKLNDNNTYGIYDNKKCEYINLSEQIDRLRNSKIHIVVKNSKGLIIFNQTGHISSRKRFNKVYDIYIGQEINSTQNENMNDLDNGVNFTEFLFNYCEERVGISIHELTRENTEDEVIK